MEPEKQQTKIRILCIQLKQLGDVLMTTAAIRELSVGIGNCEIDFLTQKPANFIYENSPYVRYVYCVRWVASEFFSLMARIRKQKYDVLIDFSGSSKTAWFSWITRIPKRIGYLGQKNSWCFTELVQIPIDKTYTAERKSALLTALSHKASSTSIDFFVSDHHKQAFDVKARAWGMKQGQLYAVSPVSKRKYKVWPADRFAAICDRLVIQHQAQIFFLIGPGEKIFAENVRSAMKQECLPIVDDLNLYEAACLLDLSNCYIGNDNGLMHLAVARKRPTYAIFGRHSPRYWKAPMALHQAIAFDPGCKTSCHYPECELECLTGISVDEVWEDLTRFLEYQP